MTKHALEIMGFILVCVLLAALEARPADSVPIQIPSTESGNEALKNSELEARLKQQSGENKNRESIQRTTTEDEEEEGNDGDDEGGDRGQSYGRPMDAPSAEELIAAETEENFDPEEEEEEEEEKEWKDEEEEDLGQEPVGDYVDEDRREYGEQNDNFRSARSHENESRSEKEIQNEAGEHGGDGSEEPEEEELEEELEEEERNEERNAGKGENTENKELYKEFGAPLNMYANERNQAEYPLERIKKTMEIETLTRSDGSSLTESDDDGGGVGDRNDVRGYLPASGAM